MLEGVLFMVVEVANNGAVGSKLCFVVNFVRREIWRKRFQPPLSRAAGRSSVALKSTTNVVSLHVDE